MTTTDATTPTTELWTTEGGQRLHLAACRHLATKDDVRPATATEVAAREICDRCQRTIDGEGSTALESLDDAIRVFQLAPDGQPLVRSAAAALEYDEIWIVHQRSYFALGREGRTVLTVHRSYLEDEHGERTVFPGFRHGGGRGAAVPAPRPEPMCRTCGYLLLPTGSCGYCD